MSAVLRYWRRLGVYRTLPLFFACGAAIEWFMVNVRVGKETFCKQAKNPEALNLFPPPHPHGNNYGLWGLKCSSLSR